MSVSEDLADTFSIFHDGYIENWSGDSQLLKLQVDCQYLAELIDPSFDHFFVHLEEVYKLEFDAWMNPISLPKTIYTEPKQIFEAGLEIAYADIKDDFVEISVNQHDTDFDYCGGLLRISCRKITTYDQSGREMTVEELDTICNNYWTKFGSN